MNEFTKRLTKFKKSPTKAKSGKGLSTAVLVVGYFWSQIGIFAGRKTKSDDDDDFIVPDDEDEEEEDEPRASSSRESTSSRASSRLSYSHTEADSDSDVPTISKPKKKSASGSSRPPLKKDTSKAGSSSAGNIFLTAAEQRAQQQKEDKKSNEEPFAFLKDPRDKDGIRPGEPGYDPRTLFIPPKFWKDFTPFEKQVRIGWQYRAFCFVVW